MQRMKIEDLERFLFQTGLALSPDGSRAAYITVQPSIAENRYNRNLRVLDLATGKETELTFRGRDGFFLWDDDETLLLCSNRDKADECEPWEDKTTFYRLSLNGGEPRRAFVIGKNVMSMRRLSEDEYLMTVLTDRNRPDPETTAKDVCKEELDYHILEEAPFWGNGRGYISGKRAELWLYNEKDGSSRRLTEIDREVSSFDVRGREIVLVSRKWDTRMPQCADWMLLNIDTGESRMLPGSGEMKMLYAGFRGNALVLCASDMQKYGSNEICGFYTLDGDALKPICRDDSIVPGGRVGGGDTGFGSGRGWKMVGETLYFIGQHECSGGVYRLTADNRIEKVTELTQGSLKMFDTNGSALVLAGCAAGEGSEVYAGTVCGEMKRATTHNASIFEERYAAKPEYIPFTDADGVKIDGWVLKPENVQPDEKHPAVLMIHGGPYSAYCAALSHEAQVYVGLGCYVFFCNPRGGSGYGEDFSDLRGKWGTVDFDDIMQFTDHVLKLFPNIDPARVGATGGSYGGFMCNWLEGHTDRFAAICSNCSISNFVADFGSCEFGMTFDANEMQATPWTDAEKMWLHSPLKYADRAKTPILFVHSTCDYNVTIDQGIEMFAAMKYFGVPSRMLVVEGENHSLSVSGKPKHRVRRMKEMLNWFDRYLKLDMDKKA